MGSQRVRHDWANNNSPGGSPSLKDNSQGPLPAGFHFCSANGRETLVGKGRGEARVFLSIPSASSGAWAVSPWPQLPWPTPAMALTWLDGPFFTHGLLGGPKSWSLKTPSLLLPFQPRGSCSYVSFVSKASVLNVLYWRRAAVHGFTKSWTREQLNNNSSKLKDLMCTLLSSVNPDGTSDPSGIELFFSFTPLTSPLSPLFLFLLPFFFSFISVKCYFDFYFIFFIFFLIVVGFVIHWNESAMDLHVFPIRSPLPPPSPPAPSRSSQCTRSKRLSHASNLGCWSVSAR